MFTKHKFTNLPPHTGKMPSVSAQASGSESGRLVADGLTLNTEEAVGGSCKTSERGEIK